jgi:dihydrofolate reductase
VKIEGVNTTISLRRDAFGHRAPGRGVKRVSVRRPSLAGPSLFGRRTYNSTLVNGDAADAVTKLKGQSGKDLTILGSGQLAQSLFRGGVIDEYVLLVHLLVLRKDAAFPDDTSAALRFADSVTTATGVNLGRWNDRG